MPGEFDFITWLRSQSKASPSVPVPPGDDLAVLKWDATDLLLVGVDQVLDGVHFDSKVHSPRAIGRKAMNRNLSDCAAMACLPFAALASVALPQGAGIEYAKELYLGLREAADPFECPVVGGDTGSWPGRLALSVTIIGRSAGMPPITRAGAKPGDGIFVTGPLGGSIAGRHMTFVPRVQLARKLAGSARITSMIDLSDGLTRDLGHICRESGVGAIVDHERIPIHRDVGADNRVAHAMGDGEDYELLCTSPDDLSALGATRIGVMTSDPAILLRSANGIEQLAIRGWEHSL